ncbi:zinc finger protein chinmo [Belonocnema kinseyi]|uniref:zinc finger protein chinmo n=1 Tax=Belonocnema kinseyi TaxID=2817044 RepID=UPI00143D9085|nr:zinc finger protein chinmo [Belonocnema kinseyi]
MNAAGGTVGNGCERGGKSILEGGSDRGGEGHGVGPRGGIMDSQQQQFCLKWNSFGNNLATAFSNLFKSESLTDVTLFCEGEGNILLQAFQLREYTCYAYHQAYICKRGPLHTRFFVSPSLYQCHYVRLLASSSTYVKHKQGINYEIVSEDGLHIQRAARKGSPSDVDAHGRASVLKDGAAFRPRSAPHPLLMENHHYQSFMHNSDTPTHPHTAPHTPTELERELERDRSVERGNGEHRESVAEDLRIKQEPVALTDRERADKLAERLSNEAYSRGFEAGNYGNTTDHLQHGVQMSAGMTSLQPAHPPTPDLSPALPTPAMWNSKINKAGTVTTPDGKKLKCPFCERLYGYETNLRAHIRQRHQGIRVPCPFCTRTFTRNNTVRRHIAREHKTELSLKAFQQANHSVSDSVPQ